MIEVNVEKRFSKLKFCYNFKTEASRIVIFGPSGAGKSNLLKMIAGFYPPELGYITVNGRTYFDKATGENLPIFSRNIGYIPQDYTLFPNMTVRENITYGMNIKKVQFDRNISEELLNILEIKDKLEEYPAKLSGGQKQRVSIARAIFSKPDILLYDEPFSALDKPIKDRLIDTILQLIDKMRESSELNIPSIFVTHNLEDAYILADDLVIIMDGNVTEYGVCKKLFTSPVYRKTAQLLDFKNIFKLEGVSDNRVCFLNKNFNIENVREGAFVGIRPENVMVIRDDACLHKKANVIKAKVTRIKNLGLFGEILTKVNITETIVVRLPLHSLEKLNLFVGKEIFLSLKTESLVILKEDR